MGVLKVKVGGVWEEVVSAVPEEVIIDVEDPFIANPSSTAELWFDPDAVRPPSMEEEVYVGPDDPDVVAPLNTVDLWYDPDDPAAMTAVPVGGTTGQALTKVDDVDGNTEWTGPYSPRAHVHAHHLYGRTTDPGTTWTVTLAAGTYLCQFAMSGVATANAIRYVNLMMDGVAVNQSKFYFNEINSHRMMNQGVTEITIPIDGDYTFTLVASASLTLDQNDFGWIVLTPAMPGAVS